MEELVLLLFGSGLVGGAVMARLYLLSFRAQSVDDYEGLTPSFDLRRHLAGPIRCEGIIFGPTGRLSSRFVADMDGQWTNEGGVLDETFRYDTGVIETRAWRVTMGDEPGTFRADADDVIGHGTGRIAGPAVRLTYRIRLPKDAGGHVLDAVDWMYLNEDGTIFNRSQFTKYGIKVAELVATMRKEKAA